MFEDSKLSVFAAVLEEGSFTKAAKKLGISQPAVSQNIAEIEKQLGIQLFERSRGAVTPTEDGMRFKEFADQINYWYNAASEAFRSGLPESLRRGESPRKDLYIGVSDEFRCHFVPQGDEKADIDVAFRNGGMSIRIEQKKADPEKEPALVLF